MPSSTKPRKRKPSTTAPATPPNWNELALPLTQANAALDTLERLVRQACSPGVRIVLPSAEATEFQALKTSTNKDLMELRTHLDDVTRQVASRLNTYVSMDDMMLQLNLGESIMHILNLATTVLKPDVERLQALRHKGVALGETTPPKGTEQ